MVDHTGDFRTDVFRTFRVVEALKGPTLVGEEIVVWHTSGLEDHRGHVMQYEMPEAHIGSTYALFLTPIQREDDKTYWAQRGVPGYAEVSGQMLTFDTPNQ